MVPEGLNLQWLVGVIDDAIGDLSEGFSRPGSESELKTDAIAGLGIYMLALCFKNSADRAVFYDFPVTCYKREVILYAFFSENRTNQLLA